MSDSIEASFAEVVSLIDQARRRAHQAVGRELVGLYWRLGEYISRKIETAEWGESVVEGLARHLASRFPGRRGFTGRNLFRMMQFYQAYRGRAIVTPLVTQLPGHTIWSLGGCFVGRISTASC